METVREGELIVWSSGRFRASAPTRRAVVRCSMNDIEFCPYLRGTAQPDLRDINRYEERAWEAILMTKTPSPQPKTDKTRFRWKIFSSAWS